MNWNWQSCEIHLIQPELGYTVGANPTKEKHVQIKLFHPHIINRPPAVGGAMAEWEFFTRTGSHYRGTWKMVYNSLNPNYDYSIGHSPSDPNQKVWQWSPEGVLKISYLIQMTDTGAGVEDAVALRDATSIGGMQPAVGRFATGKGFVDIASPILHKGPVAWERI